MKYFLTAAVILAVLLFSVNGKEGDSCFHRRMKKSGVCQEFSDCPTGTEQKQQCPFRRGDSSPTVCCVTPDAAPAAPAAPDKKKGEKDTALPCYRVLEEAKRDVPVVRGPPGTIARAMCRRYTRHVCASKRESFPFDRETVVDYCESHNKTDQLIVGGREARAKEYPHMALLGYGDKADIQYLCGGTIISPRFVLTAAHCVFSGRLPVNWVVLGARDRTDKPHPGGRPQLIAVSERIKHPDYKPPVKYHDIALLRLAKDIQFEEGFARPACLGTERRTEEKHRTATVTGWGLTEWDGEQSNLLMTVNMNLSSLASCQETYGSNSNGIPKGILDSHLCAGSPGKDSCEGDSGGPIQLFPTEPYCMFHVVGVVSFGQFCGFTTPGVYTRVASYLPWIESTVWGTPAAGERVPQPKPPVDSRIIFSQ